MVPSKLLSQYTSKHSPCLEAWTRSLGVWAGLHCSNHTYEGLRRLVIRMVVHEERATYMTTRVIRTEKQELGPW